MKTLILLSILTIILSCKPITHNKSNNSSIIINLADSNCIELNDSIILAQKSYVKNIRFEDGEVLSVMVKKHIIDSEIDSIIKRKKELNCTYLYCFKGSDLSDNLSLLKINDSLDYISIEAIHTAHLLVNEKDTISFNGRNDVRGCSSLKYGSKINAKFSIYQLYSNNYNVVNIMILDEVIPIN